MKPIKLYLSLNDGTWRIGSMDSESGVQCIDLRIKLSSYGQAYDEAQRLADILHRVTGRECKVFSPAWIMDTY